MGPEATLDLMQRILRATPAEGDADHLRLLVDNNPQVPSRVAALIDGNGPSPAPVLVQMARGLERQGADFLVMPCNTAHHYHAEIAAAVAIPFLNIMELAASHIREHSPVAQRVGLLASTALQHIQLYEPWFDAAGLAVEFPDSARQEPLMQLINAVKAGRDRETGHAAFAGAALQLEERGVDCLLIACTELSVIAPSLTAQRPVHDAADILARAAVARALSHSSPTHPHEVPCS
jgi:aspartate racemase